MTQTLFYAISLVLIVGILGGIRLMHSPKTAVAGNLIGATCMLAGVVMTLLVEGVIGMPVLWGAMAVGVLIGGLLALRVAMVQMPQLVATLNGFGGAASGIVALLVLSAAGAEPALFNRAACSLALVVGTVTLVGSIIAAGKLSGWFPQRPLILRGHEALNVGALAITTVAAVAVAWPDALSLAILIPCLLAAASVLAFLVTIRVGGADMPITISLLNSLSGVAVAIAGCAIGNPLLATAGGIVGAAGLILTEIMCRAMNRSLWKVLTGQTVVRVAVAAQAAAQALPAAVAAVADGRSAARGESATCGAMSDEALRTALKQARTAVIVPGYGMALSQAQQQVKQLMDTLEATGCRVTFAIHPVAGRMPGHMNVLLAEVDVSYDRLCELDAANEQLQTADLAIVVGANDVVNPAAMTAEGTPIYGMPILKVGRAKLVVVCNLDTAPGYAGVDNTLYTEDNVALLLGDAKDSLAGLLKLLNS